MIHGGPLSEAVRPISGVVQSEDANCQGRKKERICSGGGREYPSGTIYAHAPTRLMQNAPANTSTHAITRARPRNTRQLSSLRKSSESSSTSEAKISSPAEMAFMVPTSRSPTSESGLYSECVAIPIAWPIGVLEGVNGVM